MKKIAIALVMLMVAGVTMAHTADKGVVVQGTYGKTRIDTSFGDLSIPSDDTYSLGVGYMWQPTADYAQGVIVNVDRYSALGLEVDGSHVSSANATAYSVVYAAEFQLSRKIAFLFDGGYSLLETKVEKGGPQDTSDGIVGSVGLAYMFGAGGETMIFVEAQGARYFDMFDQGGETAAIMAGNIGVRHRF